ncbi:hypothetical protein [Scytonema sp. NUACC26]|uniref:hypothetical protein n=1 Tax=Scytonema sp. NUACC26 TaxID=3140176 RepID=UPI0034DCA01C
MKTFYIKYFYLWGEISIVPVCAESIEEARKLVCQYAVDDYWNFEVSEYKESVQ